ncbi:LCP family protein [Gordonia jinhuaensis]|nr:LCP family protein [Gordonia jinhuaensis]
MGRVRAGESLRRRIEAGGEVLDLRTPHTTGHAVTEQAGARHASGSRRASSPGRTSPSRHSGPRARTGRTTTGTEPRHHVMAVRTGRTVMVVGAVVALLITGAGWSTSKIFSDGFTHSDALSKSPHSSDGAENILLMGLDTRKDRNGNNLPDSILRQLHAGDGDEGGYNTNTLILVHVAADRKSVTAFSIPRDDLVQMDGLDVDEAKIKEAYGRKKAQVEDQLVNEGITDPAELEERGREAGREQTIATVEKLTGVPIDRFAEVSLVGFYDIAKALGGVKVCLKHSVDDSEYSGARFSAGVHTLNASQALAFVRQRHGLDNGDLDRTHRQQAFLLSVMHELQSSGTLTNVSKLQKLISALQQDVVLSSGWNLLDWAQEMSSLTGQPISFRTLPVVRYDTFDGQDVNIVDPDAIKAQVQTAFGMRPAVAAPASSSDSGDSAESVSASDSSSSDATSSDAATGDSGMPLTDSNGPAPDQGGMLTSIDGVACVN